MSQQNIRKANLKYECHNSLANVLRDWKSRLVKKKANLRILHKNDKLISTRRNLGRHAWFWPSITRQIDMSSLNSLFTHVTMLFSSMLVPSFVYFFSVFYFLLLYWLISVRYHLVTMPTCIHFGHIDILINVENRKNVHSSFDWISNE
jgi:hypothetical protein